MSPRHFTLGETGRETSTPRTPGRVVGTSGRRVRSTEVVYNRESDWWRKGSRRGRYRVHVGTRVARRSSGARQRNDMGTILN